MKWDPVLKKSKRCLQRHVGRLFEDGRIKISPKFSADFPEYAGDDWFWGIDKKPVPEAQYRQDFPETPGPAPDLWTTHPLSSGLPLFLIPELRAVSGNLRQPEVKCFAYK